jgi:hypothetical protein
MVTPRLGGTRVLGLVATVLLNACSPAAMLTPVPLSQPALTFSTAAAPQKPTGCKGPNCPPPKIPGKKVTKFVPGKKTGNDIFPALPIAAKKKKHP